jgi:hypothetical protein
MVEEGLFVFGQPGVLFGLSKSSTIGYMDAAIEMKPLDSRSRVAGETIRGWQL